MFCFGHFGNDDDDDDNKIVAFTNLSLVYNLVSLAAVLSRVLLNPSQTAATDKVAESPAT